MSGGFTPGPWIRFDYRVFAGPGALKGAGAISQICFCANNKATRTPEAEANARLIAAAPDLLAAARAMVDSIQLEKPPERWAEAACALYDAIAKAEGK